MVLMTSRLRRNPCTSTRGEYTRERVRLRVSDASATLFLRRASNPYELLFFDHLFNPVSNLFFCTMRRMENGATAVFRAVAEGRLRQRVRESDRLPVQSRYPHAFCHPRPCTARQRVTRQHNFLRPARQD